MLMQFIFLLVVLRVLQMFKITKTSQKFYRELEILDLTQKFN